MKIRVLGCSVVTAKEYPIYLTHSKPAETELNVAKISAAESLRMAQAASSGAAVAHDIRWLHVGQELEI